MAFYLSPLAGNVSLQKLENFAVKRLRFLMQIYKIAGDRLVVLDLVNNLNAVEESDCLIEGTAKDVISHYILRLLLVSDRDTADFFLKAETLLFQFRFSCLTEEEIYKLLKSTEKHTGFHGCKRVSPRIYDDENMHHVINSLHSIKQCAGSWKSVAHRYLQGNESTFLVPFQSVVSLVAQRRVLLERGWALVAFADLAEVMTGMFSTLLRLGVMQTNITRCRVMEDVRMERIASLLTSIYRAGVPICLGRNNLACLSHDEVDQSEQLFPPCMSNLHLSLRTNHRLKHNDRIQYSLFLKECGMPVHQAVQFWQLEYSQSGRLQGTCLRGWSSEHRRYVYSIRHLYGLEGARRNYRGHCCASLQRRQLGLHEQGGCPLVHFDRRHLADLLTDRDVHQEDLEDILVLADQGKPCVACRLYLKCKAGTSMGQHGVGCARRGNTSQRCGPEGSGSSQGEADQICRGNAAENSVLHDYSMADNVPEGVRLAAVDGEVEEDVGRDFRQTSLKRRSLSSMRHGHEKRVFRYENENRDGGNTGTIALQFTANSRQNLVDINSGLRQCEVISSVQRPHISGVHGKHSQALPTNHTKGSNSAISTNCEDHYMDVTGESKSSFSSCLLDVREQTADGVVDDSASCFEHTVCPSQIDSILQSQNTVNATSMHERLETVEIHKPIDFYTCYKDLINGLLNNK